MPGAAAAWTGDRLMRARRRGRGLGLWRGGAGAAAARAPANGRFRCKRKFVCSGAKTPGCYIAFPKKLTPCLENFLIPVFFI
jgi:hypothetical protein